MGQGLSMKEKSKKSVASNHRGRSYGIRKKNAFPSKQNKRKVEAMKWNGFVSDLISSEDVEAMDREKFNKRHQKQKGKKKVEEAIKTWELGKKLDIVTKRVEEELTEIKGAEDSAVLAVGIGADDVAQ
ncbi:hypothetical protein ACS0TY_013764 [Phlomoides rotata]